MFNFLKFFLIFIVGFGMSGVISNLEKTNLNSKNYNIFSRLKNNFKDKPKNIFSNRRLRLESSPSNNNNGQIPFFQNTFTLTSWENVISHQEHIDNVYTTDQYLFVQTSDNLYWVTKGQSLKLITIQGFHGLTNPGQWIYLGDLNNHIVFSDITASHPGLFYSESGGNFTDKKIADNVIVQNASFFNHFYYFGTLKHGIYTTSDWGNFQQVKTLTSDNIQSLFNNGNLVIATSFNNKSGDIFDQTVSLIKSPFNITHPVVVMQQVYRMFHLDQGIYVADASALWFLPANSNRFTKNNEDWSNWYIFNLLAINNTIFGYASEVYDIKATKIFHLDNNDDRHFISTSISDPKLLHGYYNEGYYFLNIVQYGWIIAHSIANLENASLNTTLENNHTQQMVVTNKVLIASGDQVMENTVSKPMTFYNVLPKQKAPCDFLGLSHNTLYCLLNNLTSESQRAYAIGTGFFLTVPWSKVHTNNVVYYKTSFTLELTNPSFVRTASVNKILKNVPYHHIFTNNGTYSVQLWLNDGQNLTFNFVIRRAISFNEIAVSGDTQWNSNLSATVNVRKHNFWSIPIIQSNNSTGEVQNLNITVKDQILDSRHSYYQQGTIYFNPKDGVNYFEADPHSKINLSNQETVLLSNGLYFFVLGDYLHNYYYFVVEVGSANWQTHGGFEIHDQKIQAEIKNNKIHEAFTDGSLPNQVAFLNWVANYSQAIAQTIKDVIDQKITVYGSDFFPPDSQQKIMLRSQIRGLRIQYIAPVTVRDHDLTQHKSVVILHIEQKILSSLVEKQIVLDKNGFIATDLAQHSSVAQQMHVKLKKGFVFQTKAQLNDYHLFLHQYATYIALHFRSRGESRPTGWVNSFVNFYGRGYLSSAQITSTINHFPLTTFEKNFISPYVWDDSQSPSTSLFVQITLSAKSKLKQAIATYINTKYHTLQQLNDDIKKAELNINLHGNLISAILHYFKKNLPGNKNQVAKVFATVNNHAMNFHNWLQYASNKFYDIQKKHQIHTLLYIGIGGVSFFLICCGLFLVVGWPRIVQKRQGKKLLQEETTTPKN